MPFPTVCTCVYEATAIGISITALNTAMAAANVPVDQDFLNMLSLTVTSDTNTTPGGGVVRRTIVLALNQPPFVSPFNTNPTPPGPPVNANFTGTIRSTSANDTNVGAGGSGARTVTVTYSDAAGGGPHTNAAVSLNGLTPVSLGTADHSQILSIANVSVGADQANDGDLIIEDDGGFTVGTPKRPTTRTPPQSVGYAPASFYTQFLPLGAVQTDVIGDWMKKRLEGSLGGLPVNAILPVVYT